MLSLNAMSNLDWTLEPQKEVCRKTANPNNVRSLVNNIVSIVAKILVSINVSQLCKRSTLEEVGSKIYRNIKLFQKKKKIICPPGTNPSTPIRLQN